MKNTMFPWSIALAAMTVFLLTVGGLAYTSIYELSWWLRGPLAALLFLEIGIYALVGLSIEQGKPVHVIVLAALSRWCWQLGSWLMAISMRVLPPEEVHFFVLTAVAHEETENEVQ